MKQCTELLSLIRDTKNEMNISESLRSVSVGFEVLTAVVMRRSVLWDMAPCTPLLANSFILVSCLVYSSTLKMEAIFSSKTEVDFQRSTRRYIPQDRTPPPVPNFNRICGWVHVIHSNSIYGLIKTGLCSELIWMKVRIVRQL
jgi:hypothetical protein